MCDKAVDTYPSTINCPYKYITKEMWHEAVNDSLAGLRLILNWFVTSKMIKKFFLLSMQMKI